MIAPSCLTRRRYQPRYFHMQVGRCVGKQWVSQRNEILVFSRSMSLKSVPRAIYSHLEITALLIRLIHGTLFLRMSSTCLQVDVLIHSSLGQSYFSLACIHRSGSQMKKPALLLLSDPVHEDLPDDFHACCVKINTPAFQAASHSTAGEILANSWNWPF